jgi:hypothetical protein
MPNMPTIISIIARTRDWTSPRCTSTTVIGSRRLYASAAHLFNITKWWSASLSNDFQWNKLNADLIDFVYPTRYTFLTAVATSVQFERFKAQASVLYTYVNDQTKKANSNAKEKNEVTPTVVVSYRPFTNSRFQRPLLL